MQTWSEAANMEHTIRLHMLRCHLMIKKTAHVHSGLPLCFMADLSSLLCLGAGRGSALHSAITLTLFTLVLRSGSTGEPWVLCSEPDGVLEGDMDWLVGQPVSSIVDGHTDSKVRFKISVWFTLAAKKQQPQTNNNKKKDTRTMTLWAPASCALFTVEFGDRLTELVNSCRHLYD